MNLRKNKIGHLQVNYISLDEKGAARNDRKNYMPKRLIPAYEQLKGPT